jgi:putative hydrolase
MIAPKKLNPQGKAWLPILATVRCGWKFTAMYSNTARAHELGRTNDWVVIYFQKDAEEEQCTVVTDQKGPLKGKRVVRGREIECAEHYA